MDYGGRAADRARFNGQPNVASQLDITMNEELWAARVSWCAPGLTERLDLLVVSKKDGL